MSTGEEIIGNYMGMVGYLQQEPSVISLKNGTTVLTDRRIIFLRSRLGGTSYNSMEKVEKDLKKKDSFYIDRDSITGAYSDTKLKVPYLLLEYDDGGEAKYVSFAAPELDYDSVLNLVLMFRRELQEKDPYYSLEKRSRSQIFFDQTHDQTDITQQTLRSIIRASAIDQGCDDPHYFTDSKYISEEKRKTWSQAGELLKDAAMLISIDTQRDKFNQHDLDTLKEFVQNGGTLFITPKPKTKPPNTLVGVFGFQFGEKGIQDKKNHGVFNDHIIVRDFEDHPTNKEVEAIMFGDYGCYPILPINDKVIPFARSSKDSVPPNSIIAAEIPYGKGRVIAVGQGRIYMDDYLAEEDNMTWLKNLMDYGLSVDNVTQSTLEPKPAAQEMLKPRFCTHCGTRLDPEDRFCGSCGHKTSNSVQAGDSS